MNAPIFLAIFLGLPVNWFSTGPIGQKAKIGFIPSTKIHFQGQEILVQAFCIPW